MDELIIVRRTKDKDGFQIEEKIGFPVFAEEVSTARTEFYQAMRAGIQVKITLQIRQEDYENAFLLEDEKKLYASKIIYEGQEYDIIRTYKKGKSKIELTCG